MKRFICAVIMLALIIIITASVNIYLISLSDTMIELSSDSKNTQEIKDFWQSKKIWFNIFLPHEQIDDVNSYIEELDNGKNPKETFENLKTSVEELKEKISFTAENVF